MPIAAGHDIRLATWKATKAFSPRPVAIANGERPRSAISIVMAAATSAVTAATAAMSGALPPPRKWPVLSGAVPMINGFSTTM
jgi:hypothetical protein